MSLPSVIAGIQKIYPPLSPIKGKPDNQLNWWVDPCIFFWQFIDSLKQSIPLEQLIGQYIELKQHGDHRVSLCPFHDDHNPSFTVFVQIQSFYCLGCHAGAKTVTASSDYVALLRYYHKLPFPKAVELLAEITQIALPDQQPSPANQPGKSHPTTPQPDQSDEQAESPLPPLSKDPICQ